MRVLLPAVLVLCLVQSGEGYSVLTHEQIIDLAWENQLQPMLLQRFPGSTPEQLTEAHAYAYGGSMVQDMGYYPFGNKYFSDLVHYVRSGDFVLALLRDSSTLNEYSFALGALAHYAADNSGHPTINQVTSLEFPKLRRKYGAETTYYDDPKAHIRTEFGFDMVQVAKNRYTSDRYHDFIGFEVSQDLLKRAFQDTYSIPLDSVLSNMDLSIGTFRRSVSKIIPEMTKVALISRHDVIVKETPNFQKKKFLYNLSRSDYEKQWGTIYRRPGVGARILAFFFKLIPKFGPLNALNFKIPSQHAEDLYIASVNKTVQDYDHLLSEARAGEIDLPNRDFDTGKKTKAGEYVLTDRTYARLLDDLAKHNFDQATPELRANILDFYADTSAPIETKKNKKAWARTLDELAKLKAFQPAEPQPAASGQNKTPAQSDRGDSH
jgi:hypothetical protein